MTELKVKIQKTSELAWLPTYGTDGAGAFDLYSCEEARLAPGSSVTLDTGLKFEIPPGYGMFVLSRSGHGFTYDTRLSNSVGLIDSDYRGTVKVKLTRDDVANAANRDTLYLPAYSRIAQAVIIPLPKVVFDEVTELSETKRGEGGLGSTGL